MRIEVIDLTSTEVVNVRAPHVPEFLSVQTREYIALDDKDIGFIMGKRSDMLMGILCHAGLIHPGWKGKLQPFFIVYGRWGIPPGQVIAHAIILRHD